MVSRSKPDRTMALFDFPDPNNTSEQRSVTLGPLQRLYFLNSTFIGEQSEALCGRLRKEAGAEGSLASLLGSCIPLPRTRAEQARTGDPRRSIEERYGNGERYRLDHDSAVLALAQQGFLLQDDVGRLRIVRQTRNGFFAAEGK